MRRLIPQAVIAVVAEEVSRSETHATQDSLFMYADAPGDPPEGSKHAKALAWLRRINKDESVDPLKVLGRLIEGYMDVVARPGAWDEELIPKRRGNIEHALAASGLQYFNGGVVTGGLASPTKTLEQLLRDTDFTSINVEFERALENVESSPREAISAACNILESLCKVYIEEEGLNMPGKKDLKPLWNVVRKDLNLDASELEDRDLQEIISGVLATVSGIAALRTHASSAHGDGKRIYKLEGRHARLAIHAAHTLVLFVLETWDKRKKRLFV